MNLIEGYKEFLKNGKTERECAELIMRLAGEAGYKDIAQTEQLSPGSKVYVCKRGKSVALFHIGRQPLERGMNMLGAHIDSPRLDIKQNPLYEKDFLVYLNTHYYGGIKKYQWVTMPLALHGVVCLKDGSTVRVVVGEAEGDPVFCISDILPHLAQKQMKEPASDFITGESLDLICGSGEPPAAPGPQESAQDRVQDAAAQESLAAPAPQEARAGSAKQAVLKVLKEAYGFEEKDFSSAELEAVPAGGPRDLGFDRSLILAYGQDDRSNAYASLRALLDNSADTPERTSCCVFVDKEEIGSVGATGMSSRFMENALAEVASRLERPYSDLAVRRCLQNSSMLSNDVSPAYDPLNGDLFDRENASFLGGGIALTKYTGSRGKAGASDADPEFIARLRRLLDEGGVRYQLGEIGKVDQGGGGTISRFAAEYGMYVLDTGVPVLNMHAPWEIVSKADLVSARDCYALFLRGKS